MPATLFGSPLGQLAYNQDQRVQALTKLESAEADLAEQKAQQQRRMTQILQESELSPTGAVGGGGTPENPLWKIADAAVRAGMPDAYKYANAASMIDYRRTAGETQQMRRIELGNKVKIENLDLQGRLLAGATNKESLQAALRDYENQTGERTGMLDRDGNLTVEYSPELVGRLRAKAISTKDSLLMDLRKQAIASADRLRKSREDNYTFWQNMEHQQERARAQAAGRAAGHGEGSGMFPTNAQIGVAADYLATKFPNIDEKGPWARVMGIELINEAKRLRSLNPALDSVEALEQGFNNLNKKGVFSASKSAGKSDEELNTAIPLPTSGDTKDLVEGQVYTDGTQQRRWSKQGWVTWTGKGWETEVRPVTEGITPAEARKALGLGVEVDDEALGLDSEDGED